MRGSVVYDHKVGVFGLTTVSTAVKSSPGSVTFADAVGTAEAARAARHRASHL